MKTVWLRRGLLGRHRAGKPGWPASRILSPTRSLGSTTDDPVADWERRFQPVKARLPFQRGFVGYISDSAIPGITFDAANDEGEYILTQYAMAPVIIVKGTDQEWNIGNLSGRAFEAWNARHAGAFRGHTAQGEPVPVAPDRQMNLQALAVFILPLLTGVLLAHVLWPDRTLHGLLLKASLGIGIGLGVRSLLYFVYLLLFAGQNWFIVIELVAFLTVLVLTVQRERQHGYRIVPPGWRPRLAGSGRMLFRSCRGRIPDLASQHCELSAPAQTGRLGRLDDVQPCGALRLPRPGALAAVFLAPDGSTFPRRLPAVAGNEHCRRLASPGPGHRGRTDGSERAFCDWLRWIDRLIGGERQVQWAGGARVDRLVGASRSSSTKVRGRWPMYHWLSMSWQPGASFSCTRGIPTRVCSPLPALRPVWQPGQRMKAPCW